ncbi:hypothetical protein Dda_5025 [Drechslerella dactyloides]|uniref:P-loop containing nucleoside triphosphate hydrolase protein n=1 Tax=Drechslerella dactyloides TaxID=74499 RepID=A0AAD6IXZ1_DREDA|nr:hypothetical protein Dda_5025 [Drechslerella dactyloides]
MQRFSEGIALEWSMIVVTLLLVLLRLYHRFRYERLALFEDGFVVVAWLCFFSQAVMTTELYRMGLFSNKYETLVATFNGNITDVKTLKIWYAENGTYHFNIGDSDNWVFGGRDTRSIPLSASIEKLTRALQKIRPPKLSGVPPATIKERVEKHVKSGAWRRPPTPQNQEAESMFPQWRQWHQESTESPGHAAGRAAGASNTSRQPNSRSASSTGTHPLRSREAPAPSPSKNHFSEPTPIPPTTQRGQLVKKKSHNFRDTGYNQRIFAFDIDPSQGIALTRWEGRDGMDLISEQPPPGGWKRDTKSLLTTTNPLFLSDDDASGQSRNEIDKILSGAPLFTSDTLHIDDSPEGPSDVVIQSGVFAKVQQTGRPSTASGQQENEKINDILLLNTNTPWTTFICGLQGAGKSHSLSVILENCLIPNKSIGILARPLSALVLYFAPYTPIDAGKPCEVAYLAVPGPGSENGIADGQGPVNARSVAVLASRSNLGNMKKVYGKIPGVTVRPLLFKPSQLTIKTMLHLMSVSQDNNALYLQVVTRILREMAAENPAGFSYEKFKELLSEEQLTPMQWAPLELRLELLESFIGAEQNPTPFTPVAGSVTIVDLTCPFVDAETACVLFSICLDLYSSAPSDTGKVVALDEAHKASYIENEISDTEFANSVIQNIRLQRHLGLRTIISTQDPQVHPELLELASFIIMHRFDSPRWFKTLRSHVGFDAENDTSASAEEEAEANRRATTAFEQIMCLNTGEAYLYCPQLATVEQRAYKQEIVRLGNKLLKVRIRKRLTKDGGVSKNVL